MKMRYVAFPVLVFGLLVLMNGNAFAAHSDHGCVNCHMPHKSGDPSDPDAYGVPLWSNAQTSDGLPTFDLYTSSSLDATDVGQPTGPSKLCLGCHDGSYAVFSFIPDSNAIFEQGDLASSHPVSFTYDDPLATADGGLKMPTTTQSGLGGTIQDDLLDSKDQMQCTSCHDVHTSGYGEYLLKFDIDAASEHEAILCRACHNK